MTAPVHYRVRIADPRAHLFEVTCTVAQPDASGQTFRLPGWIRGSYLVRDFAKHVVDIRSSHGPVQRLDKNHLRCAAGTGPLTLRYRVHAFDESVRKAYLDARRGFFNASSLCYCPLGFESGPMALTLERPTHADAAGWRVYTTLKAQAVDAQGYGDYSAPDYEDLMDHPVELGAHQRIDFEVDGISHALVLAGRCTADGERLARDLTRICHVERELFGQQPALDQYLFLTNVTASGYGGLEHRSSTALICARHDLPRPGDAGLSKEYRAFLGLCSHEYFHLWNVKRITAESFLQSDLTREAYTRDLWHYEGVTSYYDDLFLLRAGIFDAETYLDVVAENATRLSRTPGRAVQSLSEASFEAWIKYYQPDENTPNATVSYYVKGGLAAMCLDLTLRLRSTRTLDDVMRALWARYGAVGLGVPEGGLEAVAQEISGLDLRAEFESWIRGTDELPLPQLLAAFGVSAELRAQGSASDGGGRARGTPAAATLGLTLRAGETRIAHVLAGSAAQAAGLSSGDVLVALDGLRVTSGNWSVLQSTLRPGVPCTVHYFRGDELLTATLQPQSPPADTWTLRLLPVDGDVLARRLAWLGA